MRTLNFKAYYDLVIVGGGIQGCALLMEAQSRGLNALLVEEHDYCSQTSANSLKTIHGGIRYLQTLNLARTMVSAKEQEALLCIAPHLVQPLKCLTPTQSSLSRSRLAVGCGFMLYNIIKQLSVKNPRLPRARCLSKSALSKQTPLLDNQAISGAGVWYDAQVYNTERLGLAFISSAQALGADCFNYIKADGLVFDEANISGIKLTDKLTGQSYQITTQHVISSCGAKTNQNLDDFKINNSSTTFYLGINLIASKQLSEFALGLKAGFANNQINGDRLLFSAPWKNHTLFGTWYFPWRSSSPPSNDSLQASFEQIDQCLDDINSTFPNANLCLSDICKAHAGLLPIQHESNSTQIKLEENNLITQPDKTLKLFTVIPSKYTTCRAVAEKTINYLCQKSDLVTQPSISANTPLYGGNIADFKSFIEQAHNDYQEQLPGSVISQLAHHYGSNINRLISLTDNNKDLLKLIPGSHDHIVAQLEYALRYEQAYNINDLIFRRTSLGSSAAPSQETIDFCTDYLNKYFHTK